MTPLQSCLANAPRHGIHHHRLVRMGACATGQLGVHERRCDHCDNAQIVPNACRERACPFCRQRERGEWVRLTESLLPPVPYFHIVFTVPAQFRVFARHDPAMFHGLLMNSARQALLDICQDPRHLGATPAAFAVLHTWNQRLHLHPHVHVVVSAGGLSDDGRWLYAGSTRKKAFLVPQRVLRAHFQTLLINGMLAKFDEQAWHRLPDGIEARHQLRSWLIALKRVSWNIHLERPLSGPQALVRYLASYVNRIAIDPRRVTAYDGETVTFTWSDRRHGAIRRNDCIPAADFLRRFRQHLPPRGFVRIRYWGLMAHRTRKTQLPIARRAITTVPVPPSLPQPTAHTDQGEAHAVAGMRCPSCGIGMLIVIGCRRQAPAQPPAEPPLHDQ